MLEPETETTPSNLPVLAEGVHVGAPPEVQLVVKRILYMAFSPFSSRKYGRGDFMATIVLKGDLKVVARDGHVWFAPLIRGSILLDVPVLAPETYTQHWGQTAVMPEFFWKRIEMLVLVGPHGSLHMTRRLPAWRRL